ncbi:MAG: hypothetical protein K2H52_17010 [Lachnospiraceae bacterium]|nr:hypothetical protein [Lachnospiraceae bacterium]MDE6184053.1 hypothetical protein [Lachnospiraceae bacterium]MDE7286128.1 hypothetical protein [Lachnospiraceae bacterium]
MYAAVGTGVLTVYSIFVLAILVLTLIAMWKIFVKAGKPGWACLIPFYSQYCLFDIAWGSGWLFLLTFVPCVNFVIMIILNLKLAKAFGKGTGFGIGLVFLPTIFTLILGLSKDEYIGPQ